MKRYAIAAVLFLVSLCSTAQVTNNALSLERNGRVSLGVLPNDIADSGTTLQLWMNPQHWIGIEEVGCGAHTTTIHDLAGRRLQEITAPGIYIVNGKKHLKK